MAIHEFKFPPQKKPNTRRLPVPTGSFVIHKKNLIESGTRRFAEAMGACCLGRDKEVCMTFFFADMSFSHSTGK